MDNLEDINIYRRKKSQANDDLNQYARNPIPEADLQDEAPAPEKKGFPGVYSDLKEMAGNIPKSLLTAAIGAPESIGQFGKQVFSLPFQELKFIYNTAKNGYNPEYLPKLTANVAKGAINDINIPSSLIDYAGKKGFIPEDKGKYFRVPMPELGLKPEEENAIAQSLPTYGIPAGKIIEAIHPTMHLRQARKLANARGALAHVPEHEIAAVTDYIHPDLPLRNLMDAARTGNYDPLFSLQSDLATYGRQARFSPFARERTHGRQAYALRERMLDHMRNSLAEGGHEDVAALMKRGQNQFRRYKAVAPYAKALLALQFGANPIKKAYNSIMGPSDE